MVHEQGIGMISPVIHFTVMVGLDMLEPSSLFVFDHWFLVQWEMHQKIPSIPLSFKIYPSPFMKVKGNSSI